MHLENENGNGNVLKYAVEEIKKQLADIKIYVRELIEKVENSTNKEIFYLSKDIKVLKKDLEKTKEWQRKIIFQGVFWLISLLGTSFYIIFTFLK